MIQIDETRLLDVSVKLRFGTAGAGHVRNIVNLANESGVLQFGPTDDYGNHEASRFSALIRTQGAEQAAKVLGLRRTKDLEVLREYLGVRALSGAENRLADDNATAAESAERIKLAQQGLGSFPEFDETRLFEVVRGELGSRTNVSPSHMRQVIAEARTSFGMRDDAGTDDELRRKVSDQMTEVGLVATADALEFSGPTDSSRQKDLYFLRNFLGLHEMGPEDTSRAFAHRQVGERREFDDYVRAGD